MREYKVSRLMECKVSRMRECKVYSIKCAEGEKIWCSGLWYSSKVQRVKEYNGHNMTESKVYLCTR
jgi:hypothetical protein